jgi:hypothetical protein
LTIQGGAKMAIVRDQHRRLARRLREIREDVYGDDGIPILAKALGIPDQAWSNYESGVVLPALMVLALIELTGADPHWLLTGEGPRYTAMRCGGHPRRAGAPSRPLLRQ